MVTMSTQGPRRQRREGLTRLPVYVPEDLLQWMREQAAAANITVSSLAVSLIAQKADMPQHDFLNRST